VTRDIKFNITQANKGAALPIKVVTRASRIEIAGVIDGMLKVRLTAAPVDGKANAQLIDFLAEQTGLPKSAVEIVAGEESNKKIVSFSGLNNAELEDRLGLRNLVESSDES
jgi:uncharacterized protein